jgi:hypothetical protein
MRNLSFFEVAASLGDLKPPHVANRFLRSREGIVHRFLEAVRRGTYQLDLFVNVICHAQVFDRAASKTTEIRDLQFVTSLNPIVDFQSPFANFDLGAHVLALQISSRY